MPPSATNSSTVFSTSIVDNCQGQTELGPGHEARGFFDSLFPKKRCLTIKEIAEALFGVGKLADSKIRHIRRRVEENRLGYKIGKEWVVVREKLIDYLAKYNID